MAAGAAAARHPPGRSAPTPTLTPGTATCVVDTATWRQAEDLTELLRSCLGSLPIQPGADRAANPHLMTDWLAQQRASGR
ncbi:MAG: recombination-associated protein RdgC [Arhodomonas sp.]|nr:recombination-associated protein RdgC [Arhodomonas sp.]